MKNLELTNTEIKEWLRDYCRGVDFSTAVHVKECRVIKGKKCYLLTRGGHTGWSGIGSVSYYSSEWWIALVNDTRGWIYGNHYCEREGRQNAKTREEMWEEMKEIIRKGGE